MNDTISIESLRVPTVIGVLPHEKLIKQTLLIDLAFSIDASIPAQTDDIHQTVDYSALCAFVSQFGADSHCELIETFAQRLAQSLLENFTITDIKLTIKKPDAIKEADYVAISIERSKI